MLLKSFLPYFVGHWFGHGVSFSFYAGLSVRHYAYPDKNGYKYIYMAKILCGDVVQGRPDMKVLPPKDPKVPSIKYDSAVDNVKNPTQWVIFNDHQMYPEYILVVKQ